MSKAETKDVTNAVATNVAPLTTSQLMHGDVKTISTSEATQTWLMLSLIESMIKERKKELHERLMTEAQHHGQKNDKGGYLLGMGGSKILRERREGKQLDVDKVTALLNSKGIPILKGCDEVTSIVVNLSKIKHLINIGLLTQEEIDAITEVTWALRVTASKEIKTMLEQAKQQAGSKKQLKDDDEEEV